LNLAYSSVFSAQDFHLHVGYLSLALTAHELLNLRRLGQGVARLVLNRGPVRHRDVGIDKCHD
jgi:hypothetical protein